MTKQQHQKGFTLVELALVMVIIGLLIGGILKGQQLVTNARATSTVSQTRQIEAATTTFQDSYGALPGDMNGVGKIPGCTAACNIPGVVSRNRIIGAPAWDLVTPQVTTASTTLDVGAETALFWYYLAATDMFSGVNGNSPPAASDLVFGNALPATKFGGGFLVGNSNGRQYGVRNPSGSDFFTIKGTVLSLVISPSAPVSSIHDQLLLTSAVAEQIDRKYDDGKPATGSVQAHGSAGCADANEYLTANKSKNCGLIIGIHR